MTLKVTPSASTRSPSMAAVAVAGKGKRGGRTRLGVNKPCREEEWGVGEVVGLGKGDGEQRCGR